MSGPRTLAPRLLQFGSSSAGWLQAARTCTASQCATASSLQGFHVRDEQQQADQEQSRLPHIYRTPSLGFAASGLSTGVSASMLPARSLAMGTLAQRSAGPLGLGGLTLQPRMHSVPAAAKRSYMTEGHFLGSAFMLSTTLMFWSGLVGAVVFRRNLIVMLLATEVVMLACNLNFLFAAAYLNDMLGVIMSITITTIAACETAIGLALCVTYFHLRSAVDVEALNLLK